MSKTAIQELIEKVEWAKRNDARITTITLLKFLNDSLAKEREQIEEAYVRGHFDHEHVLKNDGLDQTSAEYYEEMYGNESETNA